MRSVIVAFLFAYSFCVSAETVNLNNSSVRSFVQWYSSKTGKPVIVNPDIKGNVTVFNADVNPTNIDDFFKSVLNANGFVMLSGNPAVVSLPSKLPSQMVFKDGQTLLLGGLIDSSFSNAERSVPVISKIPLIGWIFSSKADSNEQRIMYILLTAHIIRPL